MKRWMAVLTLALVVATSCTGSEDEGGPSTSPSPEPWRGGTLRLAMVGDFGWGYQLDPSRSAWGDDWEVFRCCLLRTLYAMNGRPASEGGATPEPDLATAPPEISVDGLTWTIHLKPGIHYAPPLDDVEITSQDVVRALLRAASADIEAYVAIYLAAIEGFDAVAAGDADAISGLETPDDHTLVVHLTEPSGDFLNWLTFSATAPIPPNPDRPEDTLGAADGHDDGYGRFLVASGPYMIEGSEDLDLSLPARAQEPIAGYVPPEVDEDGTVLAPGRLALVRNPSWDPATDDLRAAYADRIEIELRGETAGRTYRAAASDLRAGVEAGTIDAVLDMAYPSEVVGGYLADPEVRERVLQLPTGLTSYFVMRLAVPPFDDVHVRRAVALALDRAALAEAVTADPLTAVNVPGAQPAKHLVPDGLEGDLLAGYDPYPLDLDRAKEEMSLSGYDTNQDGLCDASECSGVVAVANEGTIGSSGAEVVTSSLGEVGIDVRVELAPAATEPGNWYERCTDSLAKVPLCVGFAWGNDYPNASNFLELLFASAWIAESWGQNTSLLGASSSTLRKWGYEVTDVPSADDRIDRCHGLSGSSQVECWAELDQYLMEEVLPAVLLFDMRNTFLLSERVSSFSYSDVPPYDLALDQMALVPGSE